MQFPKNSKKHHNTQFNKKFMRIGITTKLWIIYQKRKMKGRNVIIVQLAIYIHLLQIIISNY